MHARVTLIGMENALNQMADTEKSLKDPWELENVHFDPETLLSTIMIKGGQMEPLWTDPTFYYMMNRQWWKKWTPTFQKWCETLEKEYEPLWNKNAWEEIHEDTTDNGTVGTTTVNREVVDEDTTGRKTSQEVIDDDTTGSKTSQETLDRDGTSRDVLTQTEVLDGATTGTKSSTEVTDDDIEAQKITDSVEQLSGKDQVDHDYNKDIDTENKVSAFDSNLYQPHDTSHTDDVLNSENTDTTYGKKTDLDITETTTSEEDKRVTLTETTGGTTDNTTTTNSTQTGTTTDDATTDYTETTRGTDDRTTDFTENTTGTDDKTTTFNGQTDQDSENDRDFDRTSHTWGNIGVTTSQTMLKAELEVRYFNIYEHISDIFLDEMAVRVY